MSLALPGAIAEYFAAEKASDADDLIERKLMVPAHTN